jgi:hypothetical protein
VQSRSSAARRTLVALLIAAACGACSGPDKQLKEARKKLDGLAATTHAVGDAWLSRDVSSTYSRTAFQQTLQLLDKQRASLNASPKLLLDSRGAVLSQEAERLSRALAALIEDARGNDRTSAREHLSQVPQAGGAS